MISWASHVMVLIIDHLSMCLCGGLGPGMFFCRGGRLCNFIIIPDGLLVNFGKKKLLSFYEVADNYSWKITETEPFLMPSVNTFSNGAGECNEKTKVSLMWFLFTKITIFLSSLSHHWKICLVST